MTDWVKCRSATAPEETIWVNLDQVVCLSSNNLGTTITYPGAESSFVVRGSPSEILGNNKVRDA